MDDKCTHFNGCLPSKNCYMKQTNCQSSIYCYCPRFSILFFFIKFVFHDFFFGRVINSPPLRLTAFKAYQQSLPRLAIYNS